MATRAVHSTKPAASAQPAASKPQLSPAEKTAQALCGIIANNQAQAVATGERQKYGKIIADKAAEVSKLSNSGPWAKLAKELHASATTYMKSGQLPTISAELPATFTAPAQIETALKSAYQFTLLKQNSAEVGRCLEAAQKAIAALPKRQEQDQNNLSARLGLIRVLIAHKNKPAAKPAPQSCPARYAEVIKAMWPTALMVVTVSVAAIAANSVLHGFGVMPAWTRIGTVQGILGLNTSAISNVIKEAGSTGTGAKIVSKTVEKAVEQSSSLSTIATISAISVSFLTLLGLGIYCVGKTIDLTENLFSDLGEDVPAHQPQAHNAGHGHGVPAVVIERNEQQPEAPAVVNEYHEPEHDDPVVPTKPGDEWLF